MTPGLLPEQKGLLSWQLICVNPVVGHGPHKAGASVSLYLSVKPEYGKSQLPSFLLALVSCGWALNDKDGQLRLPMILMSRNK